MKKEILLRGTALLVLACCLGFSRSSSAATRYVAIIDLSKSAKSAFPQYRAELHDLLSVTPLTIGDEFIVMGISSDSFSRPNVMFSETVRTLLRSGEYQLEDCSKLGKQSFQYKACAAQNDQKDKNWERVWRDHFTNERQRWLSKWESVKAEPYSDSTDVLGALKYAEQLFENWKGEKKLILFSDMRHNTRSINLGRPLLQSDVLFDRIKRNGLLPRLKNVSLSVRGVHTQGTDPAYYDSLRQFWMHLFHESGAELDEYSVN